jgi:hypothetical protein
MPRSDVIRLPSTRRRAWPRLSVTNKFRRQPRFHPYCSTSISLSFYLSTSPSQHRADPSGLASGSCLHHQAASILCPVSLLDRCHRTDQRSVQFQVWRVADFSPPAVKVLYSLDNSSQSYLTTLNDRHDVYVHPATPLSGEESSGVLGSCYLKGVAWGVCFARYVREALALA